MECPGCRKNITSAVARCDSCGYRYPDDIRQKLSAFFDMKKEVEAVSSTLKTEVWPGLRRIWGNVDQLEKTIAGDLHRLGEQEEIIEPEEIEETEEIQETLPRSPKREEEPVIAAKQEPAPARTAPPVYAPHHEEKKDGSEFELRLGQKWILIAGIVTMVFGIGYFLKYSFDKNWIGPAGRVAMAYLWGLVLLTGGNRVRRQFETFGLYVIGGGIATLYFSTFAGFQIYHLFGQIPSYALMIMITVLACVLSVVHDTKWLAVLGLIGGFFTPVMLSTGHDFQIALMTYMAILNFGLLSIAFYKRWDLLNHLGFFFTYLLFSSWYAAYYQAAKFWPSIFFLNIFYLTYSIIPFVYHSVNKEGEKAGAFVLPALNSFIAFGFAYEMIRHYASLEWVGVITVSYAFVSLLMARHLYRRGEQKSDPFVMFSAMTMLFLIITVPVVFSRHWITIFWAAQALSLLWAAIRLEKKSLLVGSYILLGLSVGKFLAHDYTVVFGWDPSTFSIGATYTNMLVERLLTSGLLVLVCHRFSVMLRRVYGERFAVFGESDAPGFSVLAGLLLFVAMNIELSSLFYHYFPLSRPAALSVLWALQSLALIWLGVEAENKAVCLVGYLLFAAAAGKYFFIDYLDPYHFNPFRWAITGPYPALLLQRTLTAAVLLAVTRIVSRLFRESSFGLVSSAFGTGTEHHIHDALFGVMLFLVLNIETSSFFYAYMPAARFAAISVLWAFFSVILMIRGFGLKSVLLRKVSLGLFAITVIKVFLYDMANVGTPYRIVSFIILGLFLVGTSYLYHRFKDRILDEGEPR